ATARPCDVRAFAEVERRFARRFRLRGMQNEGEAVLDLAWVGRSAGPDRTRGGRGHAGTGGWVRRPSPDVAANPFLFARVAALNRCSMHRRTSCPESSLRQNGLQN